MAANEVTERSALAEIERRLLQDFPGATPADVDAVVRRPYARFDSSPTRDFVLLFVEKHARQHLVQRAVANSA